MIKYPTLKDNITIGITAPSSGIPENCHHFMDEIKERFKDVNLIIGDTVMTQYKAKSSHMNKRAKELNEFLQREDIDIIIPPWGGELAIEVIDKIDYANIQPKWIMGYSDTSLILLAITLNTGIATAHGTNIVDLRGKYSDKTTSAWEHVLKLQRNEEIVQYSSDMFQNSWTHHIPTDYIFNFTEQTKWKSLSGNNVKIEGRLLGGCIDVISHIVGTPYGDVDRFRNEYIGEEPILWYLENCESSSVTCRRMLLQMKYAGWFDNVSGIIFGRTQVDEAVDGYTMIDVYEDIADELDIPILYDVDCGHQPPQITFINGAYGIVEFDNGKGKVTQKFI